MSDEDLKAELERLRQENAALRRGSASGIRLKVSEKGAVSAYGLGRFPVTLYKEQWLKLQDMSNDIRAFIAANEAQLKANSGLPNLQVINQDVHAAKRATEAGGTPLKPNWADHSADYFAGATSLTDRKSVV